MREGDGRRGEIVQDLNGVRQRDSAPAYSILTILTADIQNFLDAIGEHNLLTTIQQTGNINSLNKDGFTLLMLVVKHKKVSLFRHLLKKLQHKDIYFKNTKCVDAIDMAIGLGYAGLLAVLKEFNLIEPVKDAGAF